MFFKKRSFRLILLSILIVLIIGFKISPNINASTGTYQVYNLTKSSDGKSINFGSIILTTTDFEKAKTEMKKHTNGVITSSGGLSPLKIVAATRGQAQSYPYRSGKDSASSTLNIYTNKSLSSAHTYIPAHYMMYVYDYFLYNGRIIADVEIQGGRGYVEVNKIDIIPQIYIDNAIEIDLGGKANYNASKNTAYKIVPYQEEYKVTKSGNYNEISVHLTRPYPGLGKINLTYGIAPDFLEAGKTYYSPDGIRFYTDRELKNRVGDKDYYAYFQWLPLRSMTNHKPEAFESLLRYYNKNDSVMMGQTHHFIEQGLKYGMNPILIFQQANLESAYGTSGYAKNRNNLFGWGAVDSDPDQAYTYDNIGEGIAIHMRSQMAAYMNVENWRHYGPSFGNKSAGITVKYASDPYYGIKVASMCYRMDKLNDYKDYNAYDLSLLKDKTSYSVKKDATTNNEWYKTKSALVNQVIVNLAKENNRIKTTLWMPNYEGKTYPGTFPLNLFEEFGYMDSGGISNIQAYGPKNSTPTAPKDWTPPKKELIFEKPAKAIVTASSLNFRESFSTSSASLGTIKQGTELVVEKIVEPKNIPWARTTYNGKTGFVHTDYLKFEKVEDEYKKGDINKDGVIDILDMMAIRLHILRIQRFNSEDLLRADLNNDGVIDILDMMAIRFHILGITLLK